jgi:repressor LexA
MCAFSTDPGDLSVIPAGVPEDVADGCVTLDPVAVLRANRRSFALRVRGQSMINAGICDGDIVVGEFTPEARPGAVVVALIDGESTLKRFVLQHGRPYLASENPNYPDLIPLSELVIQGVVHTVVRRVG